VTESTVAFENRPFVPTTGTRWYRATFLPGEPRSAGIGLDAPNRHVGLFQVDIFEPKGGGDGAARIEAERIAACYKRGTTLTYSPASVFCEKAYRTVAHEDGPWFVISVRVQWRADVAN